MLNTIWQFLKRLFNIGTKATTSQLRQPGPSPEERAAFELDKGLAFAPRHLSRADQIAWVIRSRPSDYWKGYNYN